MQHSLILIGTCCSFIALIIFLQSMSNAFKKNFLWGVIYLLFPVGSYFYYKKFITEEKGSAIWLIICLSIALVTIIIAKFL